MHLPFCFIFIFILFLSSLVSLCGWRWEYVQSSAGATLCCPAADICKSRRRGAGDEQGIAEGSLVYVPCDVTKEAAINKAVEQVTKALQGSEHGLVGVLNCCGLGYTGAYCRYKRFTHNSIRTRPKPLLFPCPQCATIFGVSLPCLACVRVRLRVCLCTWFSFL